MQANSDDTARQVREAVIEYVGFWPRVGAALIDSVIVGLVTAPMLYAVYGPEYFQPDRHGLAGSSDLIISYLLPALAIILFWRYKSATPGKMLIHAKIVDAKTYAAPSTGQLIGRYLAYFISIIPLLLGLIWVAFDRRKQGWHDKLAGTLVIRDYD
jgi:uncharacterized RDD family membrane protein YckC